MIKDEKDLAKTILRLKKDSVSKTKLLLMGTIYIKIIIQQ
jgi:hypothetical protein